jgi:hypothetical protein
MRDKLRRLLVRPRRLRGASQPNRSTIIEYRIAEYLATHPSAITSRVLDAVGMRRQDARHVLRTSERFQAVPCPPGAPARAECWDLAPTGGENVPSSRTGSP